MNKKSILYLILGIFMVSCGDSQKPSQRDDIWGKTETKETEKICVPFKYTSEGKMEIQVNLNGVPFNMLWDTNAPFTSISSLEFEILYKEEKIELSDYLSFLEQIENDSDPLAALSISINEINIPAMDNQHLVLRDHDVWVYIDGHMPPFIGQNIIQNLPKYTIDEDKGLIIFDK